MAAKLALIFVALFVLCQLFFFQADATVFRREVSSTPKSDIEEALNSLKQGFEEFVSKVEQSGVYQNASKFFEEFGQKVKQQGDELVQKIKTSGSN